MINQDFMYTLFDQKGKGPDTPRQLVGVITKLDVTLDGPGSGPIIELTIHSLEKEDALSVLEEQNVTINDLWAQIEQLRIEVDELKEKANG